MFTALSSYFFLPWFYWAASGMWALPKQQRSVAAGTAWHSALDCTWRKHRTNQELKPSRRKCVKNTDAPRLTTGFRSDGWVVNRRCRQSEMPWTHTSTVYCLMPLFTIAVYIHPSLFAGSYLAVSQICGVAPRMKINQSDRSMDRSIRTVVQLEQVLRHTAWCSELEEGEKQLASQSFCRGNRNPTNW